jgi:cytoskeletal protein CcmA (bactofilin family)
VKVKHLEIKETGTINGDVKTENLLVEMGGKYKHELPPRGGERNPP